MKDSDMGSRDLVYNFSPVYSRGIPDQQKLDSIVFKQGVTAEINLQ